MKFILFYLLLACTVFSETAPQYSVIDIPPPPTKFKNIQIDGLTFLPNGKLVVCLPSGEIFFRDNKEGKWELFAEGLHNPLGVLALSNTELIVTQRPELTRIRDLDGDGKADDYEVVTDHFGMSGNYHEFNFTPVLDTQGNYFFALGTGSSGDGVRTITRGTFNEKGRPGRMHSSAPYRGCVMKLSTEGITTPSVMDTVPPTDWALIWKGISLSPTTRATGSVPASSFMYRKAAFMDMRPAWPGKKALKGLPSMPGRKTSQASHAGLRRLSLMEAWPTPHSSDSPSPEKANLGPFTGQLLVGEMNNPESCG